jgi:hypothetical protein
VKLRKVLQGTIELYVFTNPKNSSSVHTKLKAKNEEYSKRAYLLE